MRRSVIAAAVLAVTAGPVAAEEFSYSFVSAGYSTVDVDGADGDGLGVTGSYAIADNWHIVAGYQGLGYDFDVDFSTLSAGIGYNTPVTDAIDIVAQVSYLYASVDTPLGDDNESGYGLGVGVRAHASEAVELNGSINYADIGDGSGETSLGAGFLFNFTETFAAGVAGSWGDDVSGYSAVARFYF